MGKQQRTDTTGPELFAAWVEAGTPKYREFAAQLAEQGRYKSAIGALSSIGYFAGRDSWQARKAKALDEAAQVKLEEAARIDADTFHRTSIELNRRSKFTTPENLDAIVKMRESVRKPSAKGATVTVTIEVRQAAEKVAAELGVPVDVVLAETYRMVEDGG